MYPIKNFVTQLTFSREAHRRSSEILVVWDRERSSRSPRSEIEPWWTEFSNIFFGFIFFWFMSSLKSKFVFVILWIYVCGSVFERETLFFFLFLKIVWQNNGGHNDAVEFFFRSRGIQSLFRQYMVDFTCICQIQCTKKDNARNVFNILLCFYMYIWKSHYINTSTTIFCMCMSLSSILFFFFWLG